jgi:hypothetical protein
MRTKIQIQNGVTLKILWLIFVLDFYVFHQHVLLDAMIEICYS